MRERPVPTAPQPPLLDRAIAAVAPGWAASRAVARRRLATEAARTMAIEASTSGYAAARRDRAATRNWNALPRTADADTLPNLPELRARAREQDRNAPLARGAVRTVVANVVGTGLEVTSQADQVALQAAGLTVEAIEAAETAMEREWRLFTAGTAADAQMRLTWPQMEELAFTSHMVSGDVFAAMVAPPAPGFFPFAIQLIEADAVCNPGRQPDSDTLADGIEYAGGVPVAAHVAEFPRDGRGGPRNWRRLPFRGADGAPRLLQLMRPDRINQSRGAPYLAPVLAALKELEVYTEAELRAAVLNACIAIMGQSPDGAAPIAEEAAAAGTGKAPGGGLARLDIEMTPGMMLEGFQPGEKLESFSSERPASGFDPFVLAILRQIGVGLELPFEVLVKHFTASYSAARAALLEAWKFYRGRRAWLADALHRPIYAAVIEAAVRSGRLDLPGFLDDPLMRMAWLGTAWNGPAPGQINPEVEVNAAEKRISLSLTTKASETAELTGEHWETVARRRARERALERELGLLHAEPAASPAADRDPVPPPDRPQPQDQPEKP